MADTTIYKIFPAVGIARLGNSNEYYIAPEAAKGLPINTSGADFEHTDFRDDEGKMKRQAARFQIYACQDDGTQTPISLADGDISSIEWTVHLANKKSSWYEFKTNPSNNPNYAPNHALRDANVTTQADRELLIIDPGSRTVTGANASSEFDRESSPVGASNFPPTDIQPFTIDTLGRLVTDDEGRLLVLGGLGNSGTTADTQELPSFANNDGWFDDTSDGPVTATITLTSGGDPIEVEAAWVLVAPPSYAPQIQNLVSLYDTIFDTMVQKMGFAPDLYQDGVWQESFQPHFETHILPILKRGEGYPWVVAIPPKPHKLNYEQLAQAGVAFNGLRQRIFDYLRAPATENVLVNSSNGRTMMPYLAGDASIDSDSQISRYLRLTDTQYFMLSQWATGEFTSGNGNAPTQGSGDVLSQAVLENCVGGAFSPGIEMTWVSRLAEIYQSAFRIRVKQDVTYPLSLDWKPLEDGLEPGDVTKFMAQPWQADFNLCSSQPIDGRTIWWWPPQRPLYVYAAEDVSTIDVEKPVRDLLCDGDIKQVPWVGTDFDMTANDYLIFSENLGMVNEWKDLGFIYNMSESEEQPLFLEVARIKPRLISDEDPMCSGPCHQ
ncbi:LodA/GoxA family CTQ-dependent oxidase [Candidatus Albibeggiatoa sp. nov. BB20]|uniref:LodA/GoxA family CTQ-dependent oxidase n=1 Tax=Candidatus Albibeggiatoa sp. nov. BB20 TaxID=3162723 RepID=UPI0033655B55